MIILAICIRGKFLNGTQGGAGSDVARGDQKLLSNLQGPIHLQAVQCQDPIHTDVIRIRNGGQCLIRLYYMDDLTISIGGLRDNHANGSRRSVTSRILAWYD